MELQKNLPRSNGRLSVVMRWVYAAENYPGRRSVRCKQGIGCWNMQTVWAWHWTCWLADLDTTVGGLVRCAACVCGIVFGTWERRDCGARFLFFLLGYANCGSLALDVLAGRFKYYSWRSRKVRCMCLSCWFVWEMFLDWESATASPDWVNDKPASGSVKILQLCRVSE